MTKITPQPGIMNIALYQGGDSKIDGANQVTKLSSNENPHGAGDAAREAYLAAAADLAIYPTTDHASLREAIAKVNGLDATRIICGAGSDEIIAFLCNAYAGPGDEVLYTQHGFLMYKISAMAAGAEPVQAPERDRVTDVDALIAAMTEKTRLVFIANPNNPTGTMISSDEVERLADALPEQALLVLDGAYAEFVGGDFDAGAALAEKRENVVMTRTFSKIYGLGGLRVGWGYAPVHVIETLNRVRGPFNVSGAGLAAAEAAVLDTEYTDWCQAENEKWRDWLAQALAEIGIPSDPSFANFVLARFKDEDQAERADKFLRKGSIIVRQTKSYGLPNCLRITIGDETACRAIAKFLSEFMEGENVVSYNHVALIGLGLIASSICHAARRSNKDIRITGFARSAETRATASEIGLCEVKETAADAVKDADLVILCVPVGVMGAVAAQIAPHLKAGAVVSDVGSVKAEVIAEVTPPLNNLFIPAHPLAGTEHSGPTAGFAELFDNRWCILTPVPGTDEGQVAELSAFWTMLGSNVELMEPQHHDLVLAVTSHAPHLIAYTMVGVADDLSRVTNSEVVNFSAAGFRDFTRIAASDPTMWRDVFLNNKAATLEILGRFTEELFALQRAIRTGDGDMLHDYFTRTRAIRRGILEAGQDVDEPDFGRMPKRD